MNRAVFLALGLVLLACASSAADTTAHQGDAAPSSPAPSAAAPTSSNAPPAPATETPCGDGAVATCAAWNVRSYCVSVGGKPTWKTETCTDGCFAGACSTSACADECAPGEPGCRIWAMASKTYVDATPATSLHDRARDYDARLRQTSQLHGQVVNVDYTDESRATLESYGGYRDAAIWTGSALASEAWRLVATGSPDAQDRLRELVRTLHRDFVVTGDPGYLARFVVPKSAPQPAPVSPAPSCGNDDWHCDVSSGGQTFDWVGGTSRDQYTGVVLGYTLAYLATADEDVRSIIRGDMVQIATELAKQRKGVPIRVVVNGIPLTKSIDIENVILAPSEMVDGAVSVNLSTDAVSDTQAAGMREFLPDFSMLVKPVLGIGTPIPRDSTAIMLGAIFESALMMSAGSTDPSMQAAHQALADYYAAHAAGWVKIAKGWTFATSDGCGKGYFATHIAYIMAYVWALLVKDPAIASDVHDVLFSQTMWNGVKTHKNAYFAFLWGGTREKTADPGVIADASAQLTQFTAGPRVWVGHDVTAATQYLPHDATCTAEPLCDIHTNAVDVRDRRVDDFLWQRQPWQLLDAGYPRRVFPGVDYLAAYWAARRHGFLADDRPGTCARKAP